MFAQLPRTDPSASVLRNKRTAHRIFDFWWCRCIIFGNQPIETRVEHFLSQRKVHRSSPSHLRWIVVRMTNVSPNTVRRKAFGPNYISQILVRLDSRFLVNEEATRTTKETRWWKKLMMTYHRHYSEVWWDELPTCCYTKVDSPSRRGYSFINVGYFFDYYHRILYLFQRPLLVEVCTAFCNGEVINGLLVVI